MVRRITVVADEVSMNMHNNNAIFNDQHLLWFGASLCQVIILCVSSSKFGPENMSDIRCTYNWIPKIYYPQNEKCQGCVVRSWCRTAPEKRKWCKLAIYWSAQTKNPSWYTCKIKCDINILREIPWFELSPWFMVIFTKTMSITHYTDFFRYLVSRLSRQRSKQFLISEIVRNHSHGHFKPLLR